jgi:hypothetical protein
MYTQRRRKQSTKKGGAKKVGGGIFTRGRRTVSRTMPFRTRVKSAWQTTKQRLFPCCRQLKTAEAECDRKMEDFGRKKDTGIDDLKTDNKEIQLQLLSALDTIKRYEDTNNNLKLQNSKLLKTNYSLAREMSSVINIQNKKSKNK